MASIPLRTLGKTNVQISALGMGGHHLGDAPDEKTAIDMVHEAMDGGVTFFDNCWEYHIGKSEEWLGKGLKGRRDKVFLMTKVCTHGRDAAHWRCVCWMRAFGGCRRTIWICGKFTA